MAALLRRKLQREDIKHNHDDFFEAVPYQQQLIEEERVYADSGSRVNAVIGAVLVVIESTPA